MADLGHSYRLLTIGIILITHEVRIRRCRVGSSGCRNPDLKTSKSVLGCDSHFAFSAEAHWNTRGLDQLHGVSCQRHLEFESFTQIIEFALWFTVAHGVRQANRPIGLSLCELQSVGGNQSVNVGVDHALGLLLAVVWIAGDPPIHKPEGGRSSAKQDKFLCESCRLCSREAK
ncbi:hypothetical protein BJX68DRAFT_234164 [Aspergillus pseudodeflectus]|uniref:Uncharacterized protein n=1 Tax=Aspergillus pseudodeflectus TaxID=176178 RepID=A0ABR4KPL3_9EURO